MKPRKKKNTNNKSAASKPETKATTNVEASTNNEQQTNKEVMQKSTSSETGGSTGTSNTGSRRNSSSSSNTSSNEDVKISEKKPQVKVHNSTTSTSSSLSSEENSSSKIKNETALTKSQSNSPTNHTADSISETNTTKISKNNSSSGTKKVSELVTIRIPTVHQSLVEQKPPLPPQSSQSRLATNNNNSNKREAEKSRSIQPIARSMSNAQQVAVDTRSASKPRTEKTVYKSNSLKALFIRNPNDKERVDQMIQHKQTPNSNRITASVLMVDKKHSTSISQQLLVDPNASIQKILVDFVNMQKVNEETTKTPKKKSEPKSSASRVILVNPNQQAAPLDRTLRQGGAGGASQQSQQPKASSSSSTSTSESEVVVKKYKKLAPTPDNTKKLVVQVLRDLVTLYKTDKEAFNGVGDVSSTPKTPTTSPVEQQQLNNNINKKPPKPVEIKIRKVDDKLIIKSSQPVVINTEPCDDQKPPQQIQNEYKLKMSSSAENCNVSQQLAKTNSLGNVTAVKRVRYLGVVDADPADYLRRYKDELLPSDKLPDFIKQVKPPSNLKLAADLGPARPYELEGDIEVFRHINLEKGI